MTLDFSCKELLTVFQFIIGTKRKRLNYVSFRHKIMNLWKSYGSRIKSVLVSSHYFEFVWHTKCTHWHIIFCNCISCGHTEPLCTHIQWLKILFSSGQAKLEHSMQQSVNIFATLPGGSDCPQKVLIPLNDQLCNPEPVNSRIPSIYIHRVSFVKCLFSAKSHFVTNSLYNGYLVNLPEHY